VDLIFSTMWTQISPAKQWTIEREMNDFHVIAYNGHKFTVSIYNQLHRESLRFLQQALINKADKSVVISHHLPTFMNYPEKILNDIETAPIPEEEKNQIRKDKGYHYDETVFEHSIVREGVSEKYVLSSDRQSKGTVRYYGLSAPFYNTIKQNAFLPIDEIESSLHPLLVKHFIKEFLLSSESAQLLITTHNMSLLNEKDILRKDAIWFTDKKEDGATDLYSAADYPEFRKELSYFNYYKSGKFGAIPNID